MTFRWRYVFLAAILGCKVVSANGENGTTSYSVGGDKTDDVNIVFGDFDHNHEPKEDSHGGEHGILTTTTQSPLSSEQNSSYTTQPTNEDKEDHHEEEYADDGFRVQIQKKTTATTEDPTYDVTEESRATSSSQETNHTEAAEEATDSSSSVPQFHSNSTYSDLVSTAEAETETESAFTLTSEVASSEGTVATKLDFDSETTDLTTTVSSQITDAEATSWHGTSQFSSQSSTNLYSESSRDATVVEDTHTFHFTASTPRTEYTESNTNDTQNVTVSPLSTTPGPESENSTESTHSVLYTTLLSWLRGLTGFATPQNYSSGNYTNFTVQYQGTTTLSPEEDGNGTRIYSYETTEEVHTDVETSVTEPGGTSDTTVVSSRSSMDHLSEADQRHSTSGTMITSAHDHYSPIQISTTEATGTRSSEIHSTDHDTGRRTFTESVTDHHSESEFQTTGTEISPTGTPTAFTYSTAGISEYTYAEPTTENVSTVDDETTQSETTSISSNYPSEITTQTEIVSFTTETPSSLSTKKDDIQTSPEASEVTSPHSSTSHEAATPGQIETMASTRDAIIAERSSGHHTESTLASSQSSLYEYSASSKLSDAKTTLTLSETTPTLETSQQTSPPETETAFTTIVPSTDGHSDDITTSDSPTHAYEARISSETSAAESDSTESVSTLYSSTAMSLISDRTSDITSTTSHAHTHTTADEITSEMTDTTTETFKPSSDWEFLTTSTRISSKEISSDFTTTSHTVTLVHSSDTSESITDTDATTTGPRMYVTSSLTEEPKTSNFSETEMSPSVSTTTTMSAETKLTSDFLSEEVTTNPTDTSSTYTSSTHASSTYTSSIETSSTDTAVSKSPSSQTTSTSLETTAADKTTTTPSQETTSLETPRNETMPSASYTATPTDWTRLDYPSTFRTTVVCPEVEESILTDDSFNEASDVTYDEKENAVTVVLQLSVRQVSIPGVRKLLRLAFQRFFEHALNDTYPLARQQEGSFTLNFLNNSNFEFQDFLIFSFIVLESSPSSDIPPSPLRSEELLLTLEQSQISLQDQLCLNMTSWFSGTTFDDAHSDEGSGGGILGMGGFLGRYQVLFLVLIVSASACTLVLLIGILWTRHRQRAHRNYQHKLDQERGREVVGCDLRPASDILREEKPYALSQEDCWVVQVPYMKDPAVLSDTKL